MAFWKDGKAEPKEISDLEQLFSDELWYTKSFGTPGFSIDAQEVHFSDHIFKYPGKLKWETVSDLNGPRWR